MSFINCLQTEHSNTKEISNNFFEFMLMKLEATYWLTLECYGDTNEINAI
jgi:hypothetical protein